MVRASWYQDDPEAYGTRPTAGLQGSVVKLFLILNIAAFVADYLLSYAGHGTLFVRVLGLNCDLARTMLFPILAFQLVTYQFLHGDVLHILFNMLMLWFFGRELELTLGRRRFVFLYLLSGVTGGLVQIMVALLRGGESLPPVVGASGAIYGILIYYAMRWPHRTVIFIVVAMRARTLALIFVGISLLYGFFPTHGDMTAHMCHLGGALYGFLYYRYQGSLQLMTRQIRDRNENRMKQKALDQEKEMDRLLRKIHEEGIESLSDGERKFLNETSRNYRKR